MLFDQAVGNSMRRILVVNNGSLLEQGMERLLASRGDLDVLSLDFEHEEALTACIESTHPEVIVINRDTSINLDRLFSLLGSISGFNHLQIVLISAYSNRVDVYEDQQISELHSQDFFDFLQRPITNRELRTK